MSRIEQLIGEIEEYIESCKFQPLSNTKILVNKEELEELLGKETAARIVRNGDELFHDQELDAVNLHQPKKFLGMWV